MPRVSTARASCGSSTRIVAPLSAPALITVALLTFIDKWNDFYGPLIYLQKPELQPRRPWPSQVFQSSPIARTGSD